jgi:hypothetical protein
LVRARVDGVELRRLDAGVFSYLSALTAGAPLGEAVSSAGLDQSALVHALSFVFQEALVCAVTLKIGHSAP